MAISITKAGPSGLGAIVEGLDSEALAADDEELLRRLYAESPVLCLRGQALSPDAFMRLARVFGAIQVQLLREFRDAAHPEISYIENTQRDTRGDGKRIVFGEHWHTDDSYMAKPCSTTLLYADVIPPVGGDTLFANMYRAYEALPDAMKARLHAMRAVHAYQSRRNVNPVPTRTEDEERESPKVSHPLVRTHSVTGRQALYLNLNRIDSVEGLPLKDGDALIDELFAHSIQPTFVHAHKWRLHDVVVWDNRCTMHKASADYGDHRRRMMRILIEGSAPA